jgi:hypothetical protein
MSHDRGCFRCFEDHPMSNVGCKVADCPYRDDHVAYCRDLRLKDWKPRIPTSWKHEDRLRAYTDWFV